MTYRLGDFLIQVKNAAMAKNKEVSMPSNKKIVAVAEALKRLGYLEKVVKESVSLSFKDKKPVLMDLKLVSKPGRRIYIGTRELDKRRSPSILLISTHAGIISSKEAVKSRMGGEVIAELT